MNAELEYSIDGLPDAAGDDYQQLTIMTQHAMHYTVEEVVTVRRTRRHWQFLREVTQKPKRTDWTRLLVAARIEGRVAVKTRFVDLDTITRIDLLAEVENDRLTVNIENGGSRSMISIGFYVEPCRILTAAFNPAIEMPVTQRIRLKFYAPGHEKATRPYILRELK